MSKVCVVFAITALLLATACGSNATKASTVRANVDVFAAASLLEAFTRIGKAFEKANSGTHVRFNFAGSSSLAQQIEQGAPADIFASASPANIKSVSESGGLASPPVTFARNQLEIAVPIGNPGKVRGLADFADAGKKIAVCAEQVPCGAAAKKVFAEARVTARPDTLEQDVKAVLAKVRLGDVDAGLVYRTDVKASGREVVGIEFPEASKATTTYAIAPLKRAANNTAAKAFVRYVTSDAGRAVLIAAGFASP